MNIDKPKIKIILDYLDRKIVNYYNKYTFYKECYTYFEILNILRIIQYCKTDHIKVFLINCLLDIKI